MVATRPDLAYVVGVVSRYMLIPGKKHWEPIKNIFRYLRGTEDVQLTFGSTNPTKVDGYTDFDYAGNPHNRKLTSGYIFTYGGAAISRRSKLPECVNLSTTEAEYIAASEAAKEAIWLHLSVDLSTNAKLTIYHKPSIATYRAQYTSFKTQYIT